MAGLVPRMCFLTRGVGVHKDRLVSFELALRDAEIERFNLVPVSSILPTGCEIVSKEEALKELEDGEIVFVVMARKTIDSEENVSAAVGYSRLMDENKHGYVAEYTAIGENEESVKNKAINMAEEMLKMKYGDNSKLVSDGVAVSVKGENGKYVTAVAALVFVI